MHRIHTHRQNFSRRRRCRSGGISCIATPFCQEDPGVAASSSVISLVRTGQIVKLQFGPPRRDGQPEVSTLGASIVFSLDRLYLCSMIVKNIGNDEHTIVVVDSATPCLIWPSWVYSAAQGHISR